MRFPIPTAPVLGRPRLVLVDDQPANVHALYEIFRERCEVFLATSGAQALELIAREKPDLVLSDIDMPEMDGLELCRRLKADPASHDIPLIFVTGHTSAEQETAGLAAGAVDFIAKPFNPAIVIARARTHLTLKAQTDRLRELALVDGLTGIANRRRFDERLEHDWRSCRRSGTALGVLMLDVDHFKLYNDSLGHQAGDEALRAVSGSLRQALRRPLDLVARYGGEEFACLLPGSDLAATRQVADYLRMAVQSLGLPHSQSPTAPVLTISIGVVSEVPDVRLPPHRLLAHADRNLYQAKSLGRNRCQS